MIDIHFSDQDCEEARLYSEVAARHSRLIDTIHAMPKASPSECAAHLEIALRLVNELTQLRSSAITLADVEDFVHATQLALRSLALKRSEITEDTNESRKDLWGLVSRASSPANQLCDCLVGFTKEHEALLRQKIAEQDQERSAKLERQKTRSLFSRL
jgi:hypothetical protein